MLIVKTSSSFKEEKTYILKTIFKGFLQLNYEIYFVPDKTGFHITAPGEDPLKELVLPDSFFALCEKHSPLSHQTLPTLPLKELAKKQLNIPGSEVEKLPILYGDESYGASPTSIRLGLDIFGSAFFMLSRHEEYVISERDPLGRFPAKASVAYKASFIHRPIIDEYVEVLLRQLQKLFPSIQPPSKTFSTKLSCDVDYPFDPAAYSLTHFLKRSAGDFLKRKNLFGLATNLKSIYKVRRTGPTADPFYKNLFYIMDVAERNSLAAAFYFITQRPGGAVDGNADFKGSAPIHNFMQEAIARGHEVGLHPSYHTFKDDKQTKQEFEVLQEVCRKNNIKQPIIGGRQHFLRWSFPETPRNWEMAGLDYDSTLGFAETPGFRCGTCQEFNLFDIIQKKELRLIERPLIVMEVSLLHSQYLNLTHEKAFEKATALKELCQRYNGNFTLLWHNSSFLSFKDKNLFEEIIKF